MQRPFDGIVPVMLTPFTASDAVDRDGLARLVDWYLAHGADALLAVCLSGEMFHLSLAERCEVARAVVAFAAGRVPVAVCGHVADDPDAQAAELDALARTGADALVLVTNRLDPARAGEAAFRAALERLLRRLPRTLPLGLYECPAPFRRLLGDTELEACLDTGRFVLLKDVSCDLATLVRRLALARGSPLAVVNANAALAWSAMRAGAPGFCGALTNVHPDLYAWLSRHGREDPALAAELSDFLALAAATEALGWPALAKRVHRRLGTLASDRCRAVPGDLAERVWAVDAVVEALVGGTERFRARIGAATTRFCGNDAGQV